MEMVQCSEDIAFLCRLMQLLHQFGTLALRSRLVHRLFETYIKLNRATFTYFADESIVVSEHCSRRRTGHSTHFRVPKPLPDVDKCVQNSKDGESLRSFLEESFLTETINNNMTKLLVLKKKKTINQTQWEVLFANSSVNIHDLDISLLSLLIFNMFDCKPTLDMISMPLNTNITEADDVLRIRMYRNKIAHLTSLVITSVEFNSMWNNISHAITRLIGSAYQNDIDRLKEMSFDQPAVTRYKELRKEWSETVTDIYQSLSDIKEDLRSIKKKRRHRKGVAIQLVHSDDLQKALTVLKKKGITAKVISLDESDSDSLESIVNYSSLSKSTGCLRWSEDLDYENTIRPSRSSGYLGPGTLRSKEEAKPFYEMFSGDKAAKDNTSNVARRWTMSDTGCGFTGQSPTCDDSMGYTSSLDSVFGNKDKMEPLEAMTSPAKTMHLPSVETQEIDHASSAEPKKKSLWRSFKNLF
ncbi:uncharacterized protein LOC117328057 [Pecten maximus]|uniref:uncharacterized protein LOC117328057 n=1 Tax=Pecten maximus TaxID=6579 RepID=UPI001458FA02|nr:uncharacterized protein LOC117328057 [Pecten maximus]XP_033741283.1 uncharacterized protein LOC117328057 [Pecten maximus]